MPRQNRGIERLKTEVNRSSPDAYHVCIIFTKHALLLVPALLSLSLLLVTVVARVGLDQSFPTEVIGNRGQNLYALSVLNTLVEVCLEQTCEGRCLCLIAQIEEKRGLSMSG